MTDQLAPYTPPADAKLFILLNKDGVVGQIRKYHWRSDCRRVSQDAVGGTEEADARLIRLLGLSPCPHCRDLSQPIEAEKAFKLLKRAAEESLRSLRQGNKGAAEAALIEALDAVENRSYGIEESPGGDEEG